VDTDVLVLAVSFFFDLKLLGLETLWVDFGVGKSRQNIPVHCISASLGEEKSVALRGFHSFTGCDTPSSFAHYCHQRFQSFIISHGQKHDANTLDELNKFVRSFVLYNADCDSSSLSTARQVLFT